MDPRNYICTNSHITISDNWLRMSAVIYIYKARARRNGHRKFISVYILWSQVLSCCCNVCHVKAQYYNQTVPIADPENSVRGVPIFFLVISIFYRGPYRPPLRSNWTPLGPIFFSKGSLPVPLRKHIATCDFLRGSGQMQPLWICPWCMSSYQTTFIHCRKYNQAVSMDERKITQYML